MKPERDAKTYIPGFTGEASLYTADTRYSTVALGFQPNQGDVLPQGIWCYLECIGWGNDPRDCARGCKLVR